MKFIYKTLGVQHNSIVSCIWFPCITNGGDATACFIIEYKHFLNEGHRKKSVIRYDTDKSGSGWFLPENNSEA
jgi:hypothetical protein